MSTRSRAGRLAAETHKKFIADVGNFAASFAGAEWKYSLAESDQLQIIRESFGGTEESILFSKAYGELSMWDKRSFANISALPFSDFLVELFLSGATIHTKKAAYRLATDFSNNR